MKDINDLIKNYQNIEQIMIHNGHNVLLDIKNIVSIKILTD